MSFLPNTGRIQANVLFTLSSLLLVFGVVVSIYTYYAIDSAGRTHILDRAHTMVEMLPKGATDVLSGNETDIGTPAYEDLKVLLSRVRSVNSDVRFIYLVGSAPDDTLFFFVDSEDPNSKDYSPPGQVYEEASPRMYAVFRDGVGRADGPTQDRWGVWISAYAPIYNEHGEVLALLGIDLPAKTFIGDAVAYAALPFLVSLLIVMLLLTVHHVRRKEEAALEQKAEFLSIASHEIRTPLTGVRWALEDMLSSGAVLAPETRSSLARVHDVATRLIQRVNNLLDVTKLEQQRKAKREQVRMRPFIDDIVKSFALAAQQKHVTVVVEDSISEELELFIDEDIMRHVFFNLLSNAIKYTKEGTSVRVAYEQKGTKHVFSVSDEGEGIPEQEQRNIFAGYYRAKTHEHAGIEGTGLGLYLVQKALALVGGTVTIENKQTGGARFLVTLPKK